MRTRSKLFLAVASIVALAFTSAPAYAEEVSPEPRGNVSCWAELLPEGVASPTASPTQLCVEGTEKDLPDTNLSPTHPRTQKRRSTSCPSQIF